MAWDFADGFDLYAATSDATLGYWDSGTTSGFTLVAGRFTGSQALQNASNTAWLVKSSAANDAVHHIVCAFQQTAVLSGTTLGAYFQLTDTSTNQVCIVFRSDGAILLTSATPAGTVLDTYTGAITANNTWFGLEFEIVINNSTGSWAVRKNGNTSNDHFLGSLNTRPGANPQANKLTIGMQATVTSQQIDDMYWRSGASTGTWLSDIRCYTRLPASDATAVFSRSPTANTQSPVTASTTASVTLGVGRYTAFTAAYDGTIGAASVSFGTGYTGNLKATIFASSGSAPTTTLGSANVLTNPLAGSNALTFGTPVAVTRGTSYYIGFDSDTSSGTWSVAAGTTGLSSTTSYASFPTASPTTSAAAAIVCTLTISTTTNYQSVNEAQEDGTTSYVYDSTINDADFYATPAIGSIPASVLAVTTRGFMQKSDSGTRTASVQLKSGATTVASTTATLTTSFGWVWRTDLTDPNTSATWATSAVDAAQVGPKVVS